MAVQGIVKTHAISICWAVPQRTAPMRFALPIPIIEPETTCVVLTGKESNVAEKIMTEEFKSAAKPFSNHQ